VEILLKRCTRLLSSAATTVLLLGALLTLHVPAAPLAPLAAELAAHEDAAAVVNSSALDLTAALRAGNPPAAGKHLRWSQSAPGAAYSVSLSGFHFTHCPQATEVAPGSIVVPLRC
jgi:hypothetical protein